MQAAEADQAVLMTETVIYGSVGTAALEVEEAVLPAVEMEDLKAGLAAKDLIVEATVLEKSEPEPLGLTTEALAVQTQAVVVEVQAAGAV